MTSRRAESPTTLPRAPAINPKSKIQNPKSLAALLTVALLATAVLAQSESWPDERMAGTFLCKSEFALGDFQDLLDELRALPQDLEETLRIEIRETPTELLMFRDKYRYRKYLSNRVPEGMARPAIFVKGGESNRIYTYFAKDFDENLRHEGTHSLLHGSLPVIPLWLDEGLAEYFEVAAGDRAHGHGHLTAVRWNLKFGWKPRIDRLVALQDMTEMSARDYRDAWAVVHYLLHGPPAGKAVLVGYLKDIQAETPPGQLDLQLRRQVPDLEAAVVEHFKRWGK